MQDEQTARPGGSRPGPGEDGEKGEADPGRWGLSDRPRETWTVTKPGVRAGRGMVASQHYVASAVGAEVLAAGGNAVDAAVTAGLAIGTVEPWMSGLGGCGQMVVFRAATGTASVVDFGLVASRSVDPDDYPLAPGRGHDLFAWPAVEGDRNVFGPLSVAVPTYVAGVATALERFGTWPLARCLEPAIALARAGMPVDWYATLKIATAASKLARDPEASRIFLPDGFPPAGEWGGPLPRIRLGCLADTLVGLALRGARDLYEGELARALVADAERLGIRLTLEDLAAYAPRVSDALPIAYRDARVWATPGLTAGPSLARAMELLQREHPVPGPPGGAPGAQAYRAYADALLRVYRERLEHMGDTGEPPDDPSCTTHLSVVDGEGNVVALTQTLLSLFGSRVVSPSTGILLNNGIMWFDPRPGRPNSIRPGRRPLSNMCPVVLERAGAERYALGASGGRRIMSAVLQLSSFLADFGMDLDQAFHTPRIDVSGQEQVTADPRLPPEVLAGLRGSFPVELWQHAVYPAMYACPNGAGIEAHGGRIGAAYVMSPWSAAAGV